MEIKGLTEALKKFNLDDGLIITGDSEAEEYIEGKQIIYKPLWKWLLEQEKSADCFVNHKIIHKINKL